MITSWIASQVSALFKLRRGLFAYHNPHSLPFLEIANFTILKTRKLGEMFCSTFFFLCSTFFI